jgi:hypothetical protein
MRETRGYGNALSQAIGNAFTVFLQSLIYGEVDFDAFSEVLELTQCSNHRKFYDLGSGMGRAVFVVHRNRAFTPLSIQSRRRPL